MSLVSYSNAFESLMYAIVCTCPDISHVVNAVSRYLAYLANYTDKLLNGF